MKRGSVQIAGITSVAEARSLRQWAPEAIGIPYDLQGRKEDLGEESFLASVKAVTPPVRSIWITYVTDFNRLVETVTQSGATGLQLHGEVTEGLVSAVRKALPRIYLIKSLIVGKFTLAELTEEVESFCPYVDAFLTDTWEPSTQKSGATGKVHDWSVSAELVRLSPKPIFLAGGLSPENVYDAILAVRPWGVDSHTGVEGPDGLKSAEKVQKFLSETRRAYTTLGDSKNS